MAKKKKILELTDEQKALFNPDYLKKFEDKLVEKADGITDHPMYKGDGRSALNDFWNRFTSGNADISELFKNKY